MSTNWTCAACSTTNGADAATCVVCHQPRPVPTASAPPVAPPPVAPPAAPTVPGGWPAPPPSTTPPPAPLAPPGQGGVPIAASVPAPGPAPAAAAPASSGGRRAPVLALVAVLVVLAGIAAAVVVLGGGDDESASGIDRRSDGSSSSSGTDRSGSSSDDEDEQDEPERTTTSRPRPTTTTTAPTTTTVPTRSASLFSGGAKLRAEPSLYAREVLELTDEGRALTIVGEPTADGWYRVQVDGAEGYLFGAFVMGQAPGWCVTRTISDRAPDVYAADGTLLPDEKSGNRVLITATSPSLSGWPVVLPGGARGYVSTYDVQEPSCG